MESHAIVPRPFLGGFVPENLETRGSVKQEVKQEWINVHEPYELRDWAIYFSVSRMKIAEAVMAVGPMVEDVKRYLGK
jgi:hypothetical protein